MLLLAALLSMPVLIYMIWGVFGLSIDSGPEIDFGFFQLANGISDIMACLLGVILPVVFVVSFIVVSKGWVWWKRTLLPIMLGLAICSLNFKVGAMVIRNRSRESTEYTCKTIEIYGKLEVSCPTAD
jgi:hypothetical protein